MPWIILNDPCGLACFVFAVSATWFTNYVVVHHVLVPWLRWSPIGITHFCVFELIVVLAFIAHLRCAFTNPGTLLKGGLKGSEVSTFRRIEYLLGRSACSTRACRRCRSIKPERAHHCSICASCIVRMDHHCPWVNNCVGACNQKYFVLFLVYVLLGEMYAISIFVLRFVFCVKSDTVCYPSHATIPLVLCILAFVLSLFFIAFVTAMLYDQVEAVWENSTYIENLQHFKGEERTFYEGLCEVFGETFSWRWLLPIPVPGITRRAIVEEALAQRPVPLFSPEILAKLREAEEEERLRVAEEAEANGVVNQQAAPARAYSGVVQVPSKAGTGAAEAGSAASPRMEGRTASSLLGATSALVDSLSHDGSGPTATIPRDSVHDEPVFG